MKKRQCKFKETCNNFRAGKECSYAHDKCKFGDRCKDRAGCIYYHDQSGSAQAGSSIPRKQFSQPKSETLCKFGATCNKMAEGKCPFKHENLNSKRDPPIPVSSNPRSFDLPKHETPCNFGARCNLFPLGKCPFKHDQSIAPSYQPSNNAAIREREDTSQSFKNIFSSICYNFLANRTENEGCGKLHQYTSSKNIKRIFQVDNAKILKSSIFQYYQQDEQPIYVILTQGKIVFGQLINLAKESGMEHINNSAMVFKRCYERDIGFPGQHIEDFHLLHTISQYFPRMDILVVKGSNNIYICLVNTGEIQVLPYRSIIQSIAFIKNFLIIVFLDKKRLFFTFDPANRTFRESQCPIAEGLWNFRGYHKKLFGSEVVASISQDKTVCFINENLQTHSVQMEEIVKDLLIVEHEGNVCALILTEKQLFSINLLTFQKKSLLEGGFGQGLIFSSMVHSLNHLFIAIDGWGVLIYSLDSLQTPTGVLCLGERLWKLSGDDRGNLSMISREKDEYSSWWVFKLRRH